MKRILAVLLCLLLAGAVFSLAAVSAAAEGNGGITGPEVPLEGIGASSDASGQTASKEGIDLPPVAIDPASSTAAASSGETSSKADPIAATSAPTSSASTVPETATGSEASSIEDGEPVVTIGAAESNDESVPVDPENLTPDGVPFPWVWVIVGGAAFVLAIVGGVLIYRKKKKA